MIDNSNKIQLAKEDIETETTEDDDSVAEEVEEQPQEQSNAEVALKEVLQKSDSEVEEELDGDDPVIDEEEIPEEYQEEAERILKAKKIIPIERPKNAIARPRV